MMLPPATEAFQRRALSDAVEWQLVATLYAQSATLAVGGLALATVAVITWRYAQEGWLLGWAAATLAVTGGRLILDRRFRYRPKTPGQAGMWRGRFIAGAWISGVLWGSSALGIVRHIDPMIEQLVIMVQSVIIMGAAARNAGSPLAARGQTVLGLAPLIIACLASGSGFYLIVGLFLVFELFAAFALIRYLHVRLVRLLSADEENSALVEQVNRANMDLAAANEQLEALATTDALTGIGNRRSFDRALAAEIRRAERNGSELALLMLDVDLFKGFNDRFGHQAGDDCLARVAAAIVAELHRPGDVAARYGGEEFAAILPLTGVQAASAKAEAIRARIEALVMLGGTSVAASITASIGVAMFSTENNDVRSLVASADNALYAAKKAGRNCVRVEMPEMNPSLGTQAGTVASPLR